MTLVTLLVARILKAVMVLITQTKISAHILQPVLIKQVSQKRSGPTAPQSPPAEISGYIRNKKI